MTLVKDLTAVLVQFLDRPITPQTYRELEGACYPVLHAHGLFSWRPVVVNPDECAFVVVSTTRGPIHWDLTPHRHSNMLFVLLESPEGLFFEAHNVVDG